MNELPKEIWAIQRIDGNREPYLLPPQDDDGTDGFMAWSSAEDAIRGLAHQIAMGYIEAGAIVRLSTQEVL